VRVCMCVCGCSCWCWCWSWCVCLCGWVGGCADAHTRPGPRSHPRPCVSFHVYCTVLYVLYSTCTVLYCIVLNVLHCNVHVHASVRGCRPYNGMCGACVLAGAHFRRVAEIEEYCEHLSNECQIGIIARSLCIMPVSLCIACVSFACDVQCVRVVLRFRMYACDVCCRASDYCTVQYSMFVYSYSCS
jgi:hypothetical protein